MIIKYQKEELWNILLSKSADWFLYGGNIGR